MDDETSQKKEQKKKQNRKAKQTVQSWHQEEQSKRSFNHTTA